MHHVHDPAYMGREPGDSRVCGEARSPTAMLDQLTPFWPGSFCMGAIVEDDGGGRERGIRDEKLLRFLLGIGVRSRGWADSAQWIDLPPLMSCSFLLAPLYMQAVIQISFISLLHYLLRYEFQCLPNVSE